MGCRRLLLEGAWLAVALAFACGGSSSNAPDFSVRLDRTSATLSTGRQLQLAATSAGPVIWSVDEPGGGEVSPAGLYTAPPAPGSYHVRATSAREAAKTASVAVTVVALPAAPAISTVPAQTVGKSAGATIPAQDGVTFAWTISGGAFDTPPNGTSVRFTVQGPEVSLAAVGTNAAGDQGPPSAAAVTGVPAPRKPVLTAPAAVTSGAIGNASVAAQPGIAFAWSLTGGTFATAPSGTAVTFTIAGVATLSVAGTNALGDVGESASAQVRSVAPPITPVISAAPKVSAHRKLLARVAAAPDTTYSWTAEGGTLSAEQPAEAGAALFDTGAAGTLTLHATATNAAGDSAPAASLTVQVQAAGLEVLAGALGGSGNADGTGAAARFGLPIGLAADPAGSVYLTDTYGRSVRKIAPGGVVTTVLGVGLDHPYGLARDGQGNLYLTDQQRVRKVTPEGQLWTLAGQNDVYGSADGPGSTATFNGAQGIAANADGTRLVVSDASGLRSVDQLPDGGWQVSTVGTGYPSGMFGGAAFGLAFAPDGGLWVAAGSSVGQVGPDGGLATIAGDPSQSGYADGTAPLFDSLRGLAISPAGDTLYLADTGNEVIRKVALGAGGATATTVAGTQGVKGYVDGPADAARFGWPSGLALLPNGDLVVAELDGYPAVRSISQGVVSTLAGAPWHFDFADGAAADARFAFNNTASGLPDGFAGGAVAVDAAGFVYVADANNCAVRRIAPSGDTVTLVGQPGGAAYCYGEAGVDHPSGVAVNAAGDTVYVAASRSGQVKTLVRDQASGTWAVSTIAGEVQYDPACSEADGIGAAAKFCLPSGVVQAADGALYVTDQGSHTIRKLSKGANGLWTATTIAGAGNGLMFCTKPVDGLGVDARFCGPSSIAIDPAGNLFVTDAIGNQVRKLAFEPATGKWRVSTIAGVFSSSYYSCGSADGDGPSATFCQPNGLAFDAFGTLWVTDSGTATVRALTYDARRAVWTVTTPVGRPRRRGVQPGALPAMLNAPLGLAATPLGDLVLLDSFENVVLNLRQP